MIFCLLDKNNIIEIIKKKYPKFKPSNPSIKLDPLIKTSKQKVVKIDPNNNLKEFHLKNSFLNHLFEHLKGIKIKIKLLIAILILV